VPVIDIRSDTRYSVRSQDCKWKIRIMTTTFRIYFLFAFSFFQAVEVTFSGISQWFKVQVEVSFQVISQSQVQVDVRFKQLPTNQESSFQDLLGTVKSTKLKIKKL